MRSRAPHPTLRSQRTGRALLASRGEGDVMVWRIRPRGRTPGSRRNAQAPLGCMTEARWASMVAWTSDDPCGNRYVRQSVRSPNLGPQPQPEAHRCCSIRQRYAKRFGARSNALKGPQLRFRRSAGPLLAEGLVTGPVSRLPCHRTCFENARAKAPSLPHLQALPKETKGESDLAFVPVKPRFED